jgi:hypothetical protein
LAGVKSSATGVTTGYNIIVVGGPVYAGALTGSIKDTLVNLVLIKEQKSVFMEMVKAQHHPKT